MSSPCRCAAAIIARSIAVAMKPHGGKMLALIRPSLPARCGWRRIRCRRTSGQNGHRRRDFLAAVGTDRETPSAIGRSSKRGPNYKTKPIIAAGPQ